MTAAPTEHDGLAVHSGTGSDGDNVVAFPVPRGRQALVAALRGLQPSAADIRWRSKGDPVACHLAAARIERFPDPVLLAVARELERHYTRLPGLGGLKGMCWHMLHRYDEWLRRKAQPLPAKPDPDWGAMIAFALRHPRLLSRWERRFLGSLRYYRRLSERQVEIIEALYDRAVDHT